MSLVKCKGWPSTSVTTSEAKPPSDPTTFRPRYASAMYRSPVFLSNFSPKGLPQTCSNSGANGRTQFDLQNNPTKLVINS